MTGTRIALCFDINEAEEPSLHTKSRRAGATARFQPAGSSTQKRLVEAFSCLEWLELERAYRQDPVFYKFLEERIVWHELLDLELQEIDEKIERISDQAGSGLD
jgi:hypothetical protein